MKNLTLLCVLTFCGTATASAQVIDVDQPSTNTVMAAYNQPDLAQSFVPTMTNCAGAGVLHTAGWGSGGAFTAQLWTALPNAGGTMLASASTAASPGSWTDVYWPGVAVTPGTTYFMVYLCTDPSMAIDGDTNNPYAGGQVYANAGFGGFANYDYTFRTWSDSGPSYSIAGLAGGGSATLTVSSATPGGGVLIGYSLTGAGPTPTPFGMVDMSAPISTLPTLIADAAGVASLTTGVPGRASGFTLYTQGADLTSGTLTNSLAELIL